PYPMAPLGDIAGAAAGRLNLLVLGAMLVAGVVLLRYYGRQIGGMLRLKPGPHSPAAVLTLGLLGAPTLYLMGGCTIDFTTIRYLIPLWAILPGLIAAVAVAGRRETVRAKRTSASGAAEESAVSHGANGTTGNRTDEGGEISATTVAAAWRRA